MEERIARLLKGRGDDERGFSLLELLVGMMIVSILVATASHYFLHQRRKGWGAQVKASIRNMASAENSHVYAGGAFNFSVDLDDLWAQGYRYDTADVIPHVAVADRESFCIQVNSAHDPGIVSHFSSTVGYPQEGPATPESCGDLSGTGVYVTSGNGARDGVTTAGVRLASSDPGVPGIEASREEGSPPGSMTSGPPPGATTTAGTSSGTPTGTTTSTGGSTTTPGATGTTGTVVTGGATPGATPGGTTSEGTTTDDPTGPGAEDPCKHRHDPDGDSNGGVDAPGGSGGIDKADQDCNNGSGNDADGEDDNNAGGKNR